MRKPQCLQRNPHPWTAEYSPSHEGLANGEARAVDTGFGLSSVCPGGTDDCNTRRHLETHGLSPRFLKGSSGLQIWLEDMVLDTWCLSGVGARCSTTSWAFRLIHSTEVQGQAAGQSNPNDHTTIYGASSSTNYFIYIISFNPQNTLHWFRYSHFTDKENEV